MPGRFVYGLWDGDVLFYIGKTVDAKHRFGRDYIEKHSNLHLRRRIREAGNNLRVSILVANPDDLDAAEQAAITRLMPQLTNVAHNRFKTKSGLFVEPNATNGAICVTCDAVITVKKSKYCRKCLGALLGKTPGNSKQELRELAKRAVADYSSREA